MSSRKSPHDLCGLKLGISVALVLVVTVEMPAADKDVGSLSILSAADRMRTVQLLLRFIALSGPGLAFAWVLERRETGLILWK